MMRSLRPLLDHVLVAGKPVRLLGVTMSRATAKEPFRK